MQTQFAHMNSAIKYFWLHLLLLLLLLKMLLLHATRTLWNIIKFSYSIDCSRAQRKCNLQLGTKCKYYSYATLSAKYAMPEDAKAGSTACWAAQRACTVLYWAIQLEP